MGSAMLTGGWHSAAKVKLVRKLGSAQSSAKTCIQLAAGQTGDISLSATHKLSRGERIIRYLNILGSLRRSAAGP